MSPAARIPLLNRGVIRWYSQRVTAPPMTDCMFAAVCTPLAFMGYDIPESFVAELRRASGVDKKLPTATVATKVALRELIPDCPISFGGLPDDLMLRRLAAGEICVRVMVVAGRLPERLRRFFKPSFTAGHAVVLAGARENDGRFEVLYMDPAGRPRHSYEPEFVPYSAIRGALMRTNQGLVRATWGERDAALEDRVVDEVVGSGGVPGDTTQPGAAGDPLVLSRGHFNEFAFVPRGTRFVHPVTRELVTRASADAEFRLAGRTADNRFCGVWVNTRRVRGARGMTLLLVDRRQIGEPFLR